MANTMGWGGRSGTTAALWGAGIAAAIGGVLLTRRMQQRRFERGATIGGIDKDQLADTMSQLVATCVDGEDGFETAAGAVEDPQLKALFRQYSKSRRQCRLELEGITRRIGRAPRTSGSFAGAAHHAWTAIKSAATGADARAVLAEAERGEDSALRAYEEALRSELPLGVRAVVERQLSEIRAVHDRVRERRDSYQRLH